jgi:aspartyl-tRNA(Asn)/glutamyl-tRNA(Gln) amidotransferase subunit A
VKLGDDEAVVDDLHYLSASEAIALFRARKLWPVDLMQAVIERATQGSLILKVHVDATTSASIERLPRRPPH